MSCIVKTWAIALYKTCFIIYEWTTYHTKVEELSLWLYQFDALLICFDEVGIKSGSFHDSHCIIDQTSDEKHSSISSPVSFRQTSFTKCNAINILLQSVINHWNHCLKLSISRNTIILGLSWLIIIVMILISSHLTLARELDRAQFLESRITQEKISISNSPYCYCPRYRDIFWVRVNSFPPAYSMSICL